MKLYLLSFVFDIFFSLKILFGISFNMNVLHMLGGGLGWGRECGEGFSKGRQPCLHRVVLPSKKCHPGGIGCQIEQCLM